jgi:hypothetical protein
LPPSTLTGTSTGQLYAKAADGRDSGIPHGYQKVRTCREDRNGLDWPTSATALGSDADAQP